MSLEDNLTRVVERYAELATAMSRQGEAGTDDYVRMARSCAR